MEVTQKPRYVVIMAGGIGSRFWPASTEKTPKQFLDILGVGKSLLRITYERCLKIVPDENIIVVTNSMYMPLVKNEIPEMPDHNILLEPSRNNTAPCLAYACLRIKAMAGSAVFAVLSSDHIIQKEDEFALLISQAMDYASSEEAIVTLGIKPTRPDTGYGYIKMGDSISLPRPVSAFVEKPDRITAENYITSGKYLWNAGIFIWTTETLLKAFQQYEPSILEILNPNPAIYNTSREQDFINEKYPLTKNISIDYAILEKAPNVFTIPADIGWSDLGTWVSLFDYKEKTDDNNVLQIDGKYFIEDVSGCIIRTSSGKKVVIRGLQDFIVVDENDALLIYPKSREQEIKNTINKID